VARKFFRRFTPHPDKVRSHRMVAAFGSWLHHPNLWHLNRKSVPGAVAIGLFSGLVPGPLQMLMALMLAVPLKKNLPVALLLTLYTNPFTIVPLYLLAYEYGKLLLGYEKHDARIEPFQTDWSNLADSLRALGEWMLGLGKPLGVGLVALGLTLGAAGYVATRLGWRLYVVSAWRARARRRAHR
jgi:uncharacterized protein (DUF2062 family)